MFLWDFFFLSRENPICNPHLTHSEREGQCVTPPTFPIVWHCVIQRGRRGRWAGGGVGGGRSPLINYPAKSRSQFHPIQDPWAPFVRHPLPSPPPTTTHPSPHPFTHPPVPPPPLPFLYPLQTQQTWAWIYMAQAYTLAKCNCFESGFFPCGFGFFRCWSKFFPCSSGSSFWY